MASNSATKSKKQTPEQTPNIYKIQNGGRLNSEKETYLWRTHSIIGISQRKHWRWSLLLQHRNGAKNTSRAPWHQGWWWNHAMAYWKPCQGRSHWHWWQARRYHCNWSSSWSHGRNMRHNALQKMYKNEHVDSWRADVPPNLPKWWGNTSKPFNRRGKAHIRYCYPWE